MSNLKRYRMQIVDGRVQPRHDAGTGEWYAASEVEGELDEYKMRMAIAVHYVNSLPDGDIGITDIMFLEDLLAKLSFDAFLKLHPQYKPE